MARFFPELRSGCGASEYSVLAISSEIAIRRNALPELIHGESHKHGRAVVHKQPDGRRNRWAARCRTAQVATKRMLSTTPVRGVMHHVAAMLMALVVEQLGKGATTSCKHGEDGGDAVFASVAT